MAAKLTRLLNDPVEIFQEKQILPIKLTEADKIERGLLIAQNMEQAEGIESELSEKKAIAKGELEKLTRHNGIMAVELRQGHRYAEVPIEVQKDYEVGEVRMKRLDTGEVYEVRRMSERERQREMPL